MGQDNYKDLSSMIQPVNVQSLFSNPPARRSQFDNDVEIIDLDDPRRDVKPTTWHQC